MPRELSCATATQLALPVGLAVPGSRYELAPIDSRPGEGAWPSPLRPCECHRLMLRRRVLVEQVGRRPKGSGVPLQSGIVPESKGGFCRRARLRPCRAARGVRRGRLRLGRARHLGSLTRPDPLSVSAGGRPARVDRDPVPCLTQPGTGPSLRRRLGTRRHRRDQAPGAFSAAGAAAGSLKIPHSPSAPAMQFGCWRLRTAVASAVRVLGADHVLSCPWDDGREGGGWAAALMGERARPALAPAAARDLRLRQRPRARLAGLPIAYAGTNTDAELASTVSG